jgi:hypothetical protein
MGLPSLSPLQAEVPGCVIRLMRRSAHVLSSAHGAEPLTTSSCPSKPGIVFATAARRRAAQACMP